MKLNLVATGPNEDIHGRIVEGISMAARQGVQHQQDFVIPIQHEDVAAGAVDGVPAGDFAGAILEGGEEEVAAADGGSQVPVAGAKAGKVGVC